MNLLFVTWDGPQVSYLQGLFGPILAGLVRQGYRVHVVQFTWADSARRRAIAQACEALGLTYEAHRIWRVPRSVGALLTACWGALHLRRIVRARGTQVVVARSILPSLAALLAFRRRKLPLIFDADGLLADEMVDFGGLSPTGFTYAFLRDIEAAAVRRAASVMTRSEAAVRTLVARAGSGTSPAKFFVVKNGRDPARYRYMGGAERARVRAKLGVEAEAPLVVYAGSLGPKYCLVPMLQVFQEIRARCPEAQLLLLTPAPEYFDAVSEELLKDNVQLLSVSSDEVPALLSACDLGLALIEPAYSMHAASAVKTAEYLLCGVPVVANRGIGDTSEILNHRTGFVVDEVRSPSQWTAAAEWFLHQVLPVREEFRAQCRELGKRKFSLEQAVASYERALAPLREPQPGEHLRMDGATLVGKK